MKTFTIIILLLALPLLLPAQEKISLETATEKALSKHSGLKAAALSLDRAEQLKTAALDFPKTGIYYNYDENNMADNGVPLKIWGIQQSFAFPTVYAAQRKMASLEAKMAGLAYELTAHELRKAVALVYYEIVYQNQQKKYFSELDSLNQKLSYSLQKRVEAGELPKLEHLQSLANQAAVDNQLKTIENKLLSAKKNLAALMQTDSLYDVETSVYEALQLQAKSQNTGWQSRLQHQQLMQSDQQLKISRQQLMPDLQLEYFRGTNNGPDAKIYNGFQFGVEIPLLFFGKNANNKAAVLDHKILAENQQRSRIQSQRKYEALLINLKDLQSKLETYSQQWEPLAIQLQRTANASFAQGEIGFYQYSQSLKEVVRIQLDHLEWLHQYNQAVIEINYFTF